MPDLSTPGPTDWAPFRPALPPHLRLRASVFLGISWGLLLLTLALLLCYNALQSNGSRTLSLPFPALPAEARAAICMVCLLSAFATPILAMIARTFARFPRMHVRLIEVMLMLALTCGLIAESGEFGRSAFRAPQMAAALAAYSLLTMALVASGATWGWTAAHRLGEERWWARVLLLLCGWTLLVGVVSLAVLVSTLAAFVAALPVMPSRSSLAVLALVSCAACGSLPGLWVERRIWRSRRAGERAAEAGTPNRSPQQG